MADKRSIFANFAKFYYSNPAWRNYSPEVQTTIRNSVFRQLAKGLESDPRYEEKRKQFYNMFPINLKPGEGIVREPFKGFGGGQPRALTPERKTALEERDKQIAVNPTGAQWEMPSPRVEPVLPPTPENRALTFARNMFPLPGENEKTGLKGFAERTAKALTTRHPIGRVLYAGYQALKPKTPPPQTGRVSSLREGVLQSIPGMPEDKYTAEMSKRHPNFMTAGTMGGAILQGYLGAQGLGYAFKALSPLTKSVLTRMITSGAMSGARGIEDALKNRGSWNEAFWSTVQGAGAGLISVVPEIDLPANWAQLIGQPLADLAYDVTVAGIRGEDVRSKEWWKREGFRLAPSLGFAIRDVASGKQFIITQHQMRQNLKGSLIRMSNLARRLGGNAEIKPLTDADAQPKPHPITSDIYKEARNLRDMAVEQWKVLTENDPLRGLEGRIDPGSWKDKPEWKEISPHIKRRFRARKGTRGLSLDEAAEEAGMSMADLISQLRGYDAPAKPSTNIMDYTDEAELALKSYDQPDNPEEVYQKTIGMIDQYVRDLGMSVGMTVKEVGESPTKAGPEKPKFDPSDPEAMAKIKEAKGIKKHYLANFIEGVKNVGRSFTRHHTDLDPRTDGEIIELLRQFDAIPNFSKAVTGQILKGVTAGMSPSEYELFENYILFRDLTSDVDKGKEIPFFKDPMDAVKDYIQVGNLVERFPQVKERIAQRDKFMRALRGQMVENNLLDKKYLDDDTYFRHQVLEYYNQTKGTGTGTRDVRLKKKGWQRYREGTKKDINTSYLEAEFEVLSQALSQIETVKTLNRLNKFDKSGEIKRATKLKNVIAAEGGEETHARIMELRGQLKALQGRSSHDAAELRAKIHEQLDPIDVYAPFRRQKAIGRSMIAKLAAKGELPDYPKKYEDVVRMLMQEYQSRGEDDFFYEDTAGADQNFWSFVNWLAGQTGEVSAPARYLFKALNNEQKFTRSTLGDKYLEWPQNIPDGYTVWQPEKGNRFYRAYTLSDNVVKKFLGEELDILPEHIREAIVLGGPKERWVLPENVAKTLDKINVDPAQQLALAKLYRMAYNGWKQWTLLNPMRNIKYNINNMSGDADIVFAYNPVIFKYVPKAAKDLWMMMKGKGMSKELLKAQRQGVLDSGMTIKEIPDITKNIWFKHLITKDTGIIRKAINFTPDAIGKYWKTVKDYTVWRENILRLAAYRHFNAELAKGKKLYAASRKSEVDAIPDQGDRAAKLARELIGDYGNISAAGEMIRKYLIPFYSWMEINSPRYFRLLKNIRHGDEIISGKRLAGSIVKKSLGTAIKGGLLAAKSSALYGLINLYNQARFPEEAEKVRRASRGDLHLILGRNKDTGELMTMRMQGALTDLLAMGGAEQLPHDIKAISEGQRTLGEQLQHMAEGSASRIVNAAVPFMKIPFEAGLGKTFYPNVSQPQPIRDPWEHIARGVSLELPYKYLTGKPKRGFVRDLANVAVYTRDPEEMSYYIAWGLVREFMDKNDIKKPDISPTERSNALYYYKQALRYKDHKSAAKWYKKYKDLGGKKSDMMKSFRMSDPMTFFRGEKGARFKKKFKEWLTPEERKYMDDAKAFVARMRKERSKVRMKVIAK